MAGITVNTIHNANIYLDGASLLGRADEFKLPKVKFKMVDHKAVGMIGTIKLPAGIEALEGEIKWNSFYQDVWAKVLDPFSARAIAGARQSGDVRERRTYCTGAVRGVPDRIVL
ncbi:phage major tail tube protein [Paraburkholderia fungorum]|uniref:phage major tail tube protein n=1 Tax=Paraburkholderia fungorum TaxID=134537 RepID=UPI00402BC4AE